jgi:phosphatidylglycerophosphate synthase
MMGSMQLLDKIGDIIRALIRAFVRPLNRITGGRLNPSAVTFTGLFMHVPIALLIATRHNLWAAGLLVIFGLFDTVDGELARLQGRASSAGMLLDATTDRMKEVMLYCGAAYAIIATTERPYLAVWAVAACGASLCVSYVKAKGETAVKDSNLTPNQINRLFKDGLLRFEVRMFILALGLLSNRVALAVIVITILSTLTAFGRLTRITRRLLDVQS